MSSKYNILNGIPPTVFPVDYSAGLFIYERLIENIHEGIAFVSITKKLQNEGYPSLRTISFY